MEEQSLVPEDLVTSAINIVNSDKSDVAKICLTDFLLSDVLRKHKELSKVIGIILAKQKQIWAQLSEEKIHAIWQELQWCGEKDFGYSFESYATQRTGLKWTTIINLIRVARTWYLDGPDVPEQIRLIDAATGEPTGETVGGLDIGALDVSKLLLCTRLQREGRMNGETWGLLANPDVTHKQLRSRLMSDEKVSFRRRIIVEDGLLLVMNPAEAEAKIFGELDLASDDEDVQWGVGRVLTAIGAKVK